MLNKLPTREDNAGRKSWVWWSSATELDFFFLLLPAPFVMPVSFFCSLFPWVCLYVLVSYGGLVDLIIIIVDWVALFYLNLSFSLPHHF